MPRHLSNRAWEFISSPKIEGAGVVHTVAGDPGGTTKWGFAQRYNPDIDVTTLTEEQAYWRFHERYWEKVRASEMPWPLALAVVDYSFNTGVLKAVKTLQKSL